MAEARKDGCELRPGTGFLVSDGKVYSYYSHSIQYNIADIADQSMYWGDVSTVLVPSE